MCGLSGVCGEVSTKEEGAFKNLLVFSSMRGMDSTGAGSVSRALINGNHEVKLSKEVGPFPFLWDLKSFDKLFYGVNCCYIGHNRSKTVGEVTRKNAHPFMFDDVLGAHNGTIDYQNKNRLERGSDFKTDSEAIFNNIQVHGIKDTISKIQASEAYALVWYDRRDHTINFIRNDKRPLVWCTVNKGKTLFWASEYEILVAALNRQDLTPDDKVWWFTADMHYSWVIPEFASTVLGKPKMEKMENHKPDYKVSNGYHHFNNQHNYHNHTNNNTGKKSGNVGDEWGTGYENDFGDDAAYQICQFGGDSCGIVPATTKADGPVTETAGVVTSIAQGSFSKTLPEKVIEGCKKLLESCSNKELPTSLMTSEEKAKIITPYEVMKRRAWEHMINSGIDVPKPETDMLKYRSGNLVVYRNLTSGMWTFFRWDITREEWAKYSSALAPGDMPYGILDINARHCFRHVKRGKTKEIYYKGWKKDLSQDTFNKLMNKGCLNCDRVPEWGNEVQFISEDHLFLCEFCSLTPNLAEDLKNKKTTSIAA